MSPEINGDSGDQLGNGINSVEDTYTVANVWEEDADNHQLPGLGHRKAVEELNSLEVAPKPTMIKGSNSANQNMLERENAQKERTFSPDHTTCLEPLLANTEFELSSRGITALRKESSAHKVYRAYDNSRKAWLKKDVLVRELWLHYAKCHKESNREGRGKKITIVTEMNGNSVEEKIVEKSEEKRQEECHENKNILLTDKEQKDQEKFNNRNYSIGRCEQDVDDTSLREAKDPDTSGNSVDDDILDFLDD